MKKELTMKQEQFCQYYVDTGIASAAYRLAYDTSKMKSGEVGSQQGKGGADADEHRQC